MTSSRQKFFLDDVGLARLHPSLGCACTTTGAEAMPANPDEVRIKALLETWADAVRRHDLPAILAHHDTDMVMFDLPPPLQCRGIGAYEETWKLMFRCHKPGVAFEFRELAVTAGSDVAFAVAIMWCGPGSSSNPAERDGFPFRLTVGLRKVDGDWRITHEHHSLPATD
jgi:ketosteroid isomerase-like protein